MLDQNDLPSQSEDGDRGSSHPLFNKGAYSALEVPTQITGVVAGQYMLYQHKCQLINSVSFFELQSSLII